MSQINAPNNGQMKDNSIRVWLPWGLLAGAVMLLMPLVAWSQVTINPGETHKFTQSDGEQTGCRAGDLPVTCLEASGSVSATPTDNEVITNLGSVGVDSTPRYADGSVYVDFFVPGSPDNVVDAYISVSYDFVSTLVTGSVYTVANSVGLRIQDRTWGEVFHASQTIASASRDGDQGISDVNFGVQRNVELDSTANWAVKLRRGGTYRLHFELQTYSQLGGNARARANWRVIGITIGDDLVDQLANHDAAIQQGISQILTEFSSLHAEHAEIKAMLSGITQDQEEIKQLLLTPQGLRPGFPTGTPVGSGQSGNGNGKP